MLRGAPEAVWDVGGQGIGECSNGSFPGRQAEGFQPKGVSFAMGLILLVLLLALLFFGLGFAAHLLWVLAVVFFIAWVAGFAFRSGEGARWYRW